VAESNCEVIVQGKGIKHSWKQYMEKLMNEENNRITVYQLELKKDQQIALGLRSCCSTEKYDKSKPGFLRASSRNTTHRGHWKSADIGFMSWYFEINCLQCFDTVVWATGTVSGL